MSEEKPTNGAKSFFDFFKSLFGCISHGASAADKIKDFAAPDAEVPQAPVAPVSL